MTTLRIAGGRLLDPTQAQAERVGDLTVRDGRLVEPVPGERIDAQIDARGLVVMAGGIDMHSHIGGGKVNLARMLMPEDHRAAAWDAAPSAAALAGCSNGLCTPGTVVTGHRYAAMGYTTAFEPAMLMANARQAHLEMGDTPVLDHGAYVLAGNDELFLKLLSQGADFERLRDYVGWLVHASKAHGVKVVNAGGISAFKFNQRALDVDDEHVHWRVTPRRVLATLARAVHALGLPHRLHIHGSNLGVPGNIASTLKTIEALEGHPAHLTHIQFHSYGTEGPRKFSSAALQLAEAVNANPHISIDVGQIIFGQTVTASGDTMMQVRNAELASPRKWIASDIECDAGCGVVPFRYREQSYVNALQWAIGLEIFLLVKDPWQLALTTDHPNGGPFTSYPHLIRLLMDKPFRDDQLARLHPDVAAQGALKDIAREYSLAEIAVITRAAPARLLSLADKGHLGTGAAADLAIYRDDPDREAMFTTPEYVFKDGVLIARRGEVRAAPTGGVHFARPAFDRAGIERLIAKEGGDYLSLNLRRAVIDDDELCRCCGGTRLLPAACHEVRA
jgi:formylmethanofuran dehydrogenase subunit A